MTFHPEQVEEFLRVFDQSSHLIRRFNGCNHLELLRDKRNPSIFFTYSFWTSETDLENYRNSELFKGVWAKTSVLFSEKASAWSVDREREL